MGKLIAEALVGTLVIFVVAEAMQLISWVSAWLREPLDKTFIAGGAICYVVFRTARF